MSLKPQTFTIKFLGKQQQSADTYTFKFERPSNFNFVAGEYLKMILAIKNPDSRGVSRYFTISASPTEENIAITTKVIKSSFKKTFGSLKVGAKVKIRGPWGDISLDEKDKTPRVFLAGGIGITPARSMMIYARDNNLDIPITLFVSFSREEEVIFYDELTGLKNKKLKAIYMISHPEGSKWKGETGRLDGEKITKYVPDVKNSIFYLTGPLAFVEAIEKLVRSLKVPKKNIVAEEFPGY